MTKRDRLDPNYDKLDKALRSIGYGFENAVADIVDNSVDAGAKNVLVRLIIRRDGRFDLLVRDDGSGMTAGHLREAMRFGADVSNDLERLGKFGLGLKLASLSQARSLTVITRAGGATSGRAWPEDGIASGFHSNILSPAEIRRYLASLIPDRPLRKVGTVVIWETLYRVGSSHGKPEEYAQKLARRLLDHLSLAFHRFLSGRPRKVEMSVDIFDEAEGNGGLEMILDPLDPFGYERSGNPEFPAPMKVANKYSSAIKIVAHIWPPNSKSNNYRLPGGANAKQGFYFYRNNRLIQGGGWNGMRETEPHSSLARVEIDLSPTVDVEVSLDVRKIDIRLPEEISEAIRSAKSERGLDFQKFLSLADEAYRKRAPSEAELPLIPSAGLPADLSQFLHQELRIKRTTRHRDLKFKWKALKKSQFFEIDRDAGHLNINAAYRRALLHGLAGSATDIPVVKCLLFLALEDALKSERNGARIKARIEQVNKILVRAVRHERG